MRDKQVTCPILFASFDPNSHLSKRGLIRASWLLYTKPSLGSRGPSGHNVVSLRSRRAAQRSNVTPATTIFARTCIRPFLGSVRYFSLAGLTILHPILLDSRTSLVALPNSFLLRCRWNAVPSTLVCRPFATRQVAPHWSPGLESN